MGNFYKKSIQSTIIQPEPERSIAELGFETREFNSIEGCAKFPAFLTSIERMIKETQYIDTQVIVGCETFHCHMIVLKSYSSYFANLERNKEINCERIELPENQVTPIAFHIIYEWMLSDENHLPRLNFAETYKAAKFLNIFELLCQFMSIIDNPNVITEREALSIFLEAIDVNEKDLKRFMVNKLSKIFLTFVASWEYLMLSIEEIQVIFNSNRLAINSELDMLFSAIRWLQHDWPLRKKSIANLLNSVRFTQILSWQLVEFKNYPQELEHIFKLEEVQTKIDDALKIRSVRDCRIIQDDEIPQIDLISRRLINDPLWNCFEFHKNPNLYQSYCNFCSYINKLDAVHWRNVKYADPKHELIFF